MHSYVCLCVCNMCMCVCIYIGGLACVYVCMCIHANTLVTTYSKFR